jgi:predicted ribosome quality control (RQC) complex YloA/Tae2 family protein
LNLEQALDELTRWEREAKRLEGELKAAKAEVDTANQSVHLLMDHCHQLHEQNKAIRADRNAYITISDLDAITDNLDLGELVLMMGMTFAAILSRFGASAARDAIQAATDTLDQGPPKQ